MGKGVNKVIVIGNLGAEPETRTMPSGVAVTKLSVATSETWKDKQTGDSQERTEWHRIALYGRLAEITAQYLKKGSKVFIEGSLRTNKWQDKSGNDRYTTEIIANNMQMLDSRGGNGDQDSGSSYNNSYSKNNSSSNSNSPSKVEMPSMEEYEDDLPF